MKKERKKKVNTELVWDKDLTPALRARPWRSMGKKKGKKRKEKRGEGKSFYNTMVYFRAFASFGTRKQDR